MDAEIARVCHEANRAYCMSTGDHSQPTWDTAPIWQKQSAIVGVEAALADLDRTPEDSHVAWVAHKEQEGWKYGKVKRPEAKEHPCMVPYDQLPDVQKAKDHLFLAVVRALGAYTAAAQRAPAVVPPPRVYKTPPEPAEIPQLDPEEETKPKKKRTRKKKSE